MEIPESEIEEKKGPRRYTNKYKREILEKAEKCEHGELGELLRKEGLYFAALSRWRKEHEEGKLNGAEKKRGRKKRKVNIISCFHHKENKHKPYRRTLN